MELGRCFNDTKTSYILKDQGKFDFSCHDPFNASLLLYTYKLFLLEMLSKYQQISFSNLCQIRVNDMCEQALARFGCVYVRNLLSQNLSQSQSSCEPKQLIHTIYLQANMTYKSTIHKWVFILGVTFGTFGPLDFWKMNSITLIFVIVLDIFISVPFPSHRQLYVA